MGDRSHSLDCCSTVIHNHYCSHSYAGEKESKTAEGNGRDHAQENVWLKQDYCGLINCLHMKCHFSSKKIITLL